MHQLSLLGDPPFRASPKDSRISTFTDNMSFPIHRWFRYSAGFSAEWAASLISSKSYSKDFRVIDPFAGSGTTLLAADSVDVHSVGFETHPFMYRVANCKLHWDVDVKKYLSLVDNVVNLARDTYMAEPSTDQDLLLKCYGSESLARLESLRNSYQQQRDCDSHEWELVWLSITAILRECSSVGTAQWQYVLPNKAKAKVAEPFEAFTKKAFLFAQDIRKMRDMRVNHLSEVLLTDARHPDWSEDNSFDLVITSPPYPNNYDYADATRLEMTFWGEIAGWSDLQPVVRQYLIRSCSQHSAAEKLKLDRLLDDPSVAAIKSELSAVCKELEEIRLTKGGKKTYHTMVAAYFADLANVWRSLRRVCKEGATACFVIGDSAPYGVYVPVDKWLAILAKEMGFADTSFEKLRDRNIKWKNRKHRVPLQEGRLWVHG